MVRNILKWCDNEMNKALAENDEARGVAMAAHAGAVEGVVDGLAVVGAVGFIVSVVGVIKGLLK